MVYIPSGYDGKKNVPTNDASYTNPETECTRRFETPHVVDKTQIYRAPARAPHARMRSVPSLLHRTSTQSSNRYQRPVENYSAHYQQPFDDEEYSARTHDSFQLGNGASYILAQALRTIAGLLRIYSWLLAAVCLVSTFGFSIGRAFILDTILIAQAPIPRVLLGYMVVPSIFGGVVRGDLVVLACLAACIDYVCLRWAWRLLHR